MSRKNSILYILEGKKPSLLNWYVFSYMGRPYKNDDGTYFWMTPYWFWKLKNNCKKKKIK